ncbi:MAG: hypothetical protein FWG13_05600 [Leptospirales bacterium]|nr:hypothetical protein [Leptospirales bacterium]
MFEELEKARLDCLECFRCPLSKTRLNVVFSDGVPNSKLMPVFHPSYLLRNEQRTKGSPKWLMWQDIREIRREYDTLGGQA